MHTNQPKEEPSVELGYESRDIDIRSIHKAVFFFFVFATVMFITGALIYANLSPAFSPSYVKAKQDLRIPKPPNPLLQDNVSNFTDIMKLRQNETKILTTTGWTDDTHTAVHIPIERAIQLLADRGLPKTGADVPAVTKGNTTDEKKEAAPSTTPATTVPTNVPESNVTSAKDLSKPATAAKH